MPHNFYFKIFINGVNFVYMEAVSVWPLKQNISRLVNLICHFKAIAICLYIYIEYI